MIKNIKMYVLAVLLSASLMPLLAFEVIFFSQTYSFLVQKDVENISFALNREKKYVEDFIKININDMSIIAYSDDVKGQNAKDIIGIFKRYITARKDYEKIRYIGKDGSIIEVSRGEEGRIYKKTPLDITEIFSLNRGEFAVYTENMNEGKFIVYSYPVVINGKNTGVIAGYMPLSNINFLSNDYSKNDMGRIFIKDSRDRYITASCDKQISQEYDLDLPIEKTDWRIYAEFNRGKFVLSALKMISSNMIIFFVLVIVAVIPISFYISDVIKKPLVELVYCTKYLSKLSGESRVFYRISEIIELKKNFNKIIDLINNNRTEFQEEIYLDKLTGLYNNRYIEDKLSSKIDISEMSKICFVIVNIDIFKDGIRGMQHGVIDIALAHIGDIIRDNIRFKDIPIRLSQNEFLIILTEADGQKIKATIDRIQEAIEGFKFKEKEEEIKFKVSTGIAIYNGEIESTIIESRTNRDKNR